MNLHLPSGTELRKEDKAFIEQVIISELKDMAASLRNVIETLEKIAAK